MPGTVTIPMPLPVNRLGKANKKAILGLAIKTRLREMKSATIYRRDRQHIFTEAKRILALYPENQRQGVTFNTSDMKNALQDFNYQAGQHGTVKEGEAVAINKLAWARAKLIHRHLPIPTTTARSLYFKLPDRLRTNDEFWKELENGDKRSVAHRTLKEELAKVNPPATKPIPANPPATKPPAAKPAPAAKPPAAKHDSLEATFLKLVIDLGLIRSREIIDNFNEELLNGLGKL